MRILVVDDETQILEVIKSILEAAGHSVETRVNGKEALIACRSTDFDFVLTDERMPGGSGIEFVIKLMAEKSSPPTIALMTGYTDVNLDEAKSFGIAKIFAKPFSPKDLLNYLASLSPPAG